MNYLSDLSYLLALGLVSSALTYAAFETWSSIRKSLNQTVGSRLNDLLDIRPAEYSDTAILEFRSLALHANAAGPEFQFRVLGFLEKLYLYTTVQGKVFENFSTKLNFELQTVKIPDETRKSLVEILDAWKFERDANKFQLDEAIARQKYLGRRQKTFRALQNMVVRWRGRRFLEHNRKLIVYHLKKSILNQ
jgi:hypothetical protein